MEQKRKILVAGDRRTERITLADALARGRYSVALASCGELPFAMAREHPDLILVDVGKPLPSASYLRGLLGGDAQGGCPVVLHSDEADLAVGRLARDIKAAGCIARSARPDAILENIAPFFAASEGSRPGSSPPSSPPRDFVALSRQTTRSGFVAACPFPFLVYTAPLVPPRSDRTIGLLDGLDAVEGIGRRNTPLTRSLRALEIRKSTRTAPDQITVGRTRENDVVIDHQHMSRFHAFFVEKDGVMTLTDAGSHNGTWVAGRLLSPNGAPSAPMASGDIVRFGELELTFMSPSGCWDVLRVNVR
jgi:CheY-like chemotaxis protein